MHNYCKNTLMISADYIYYEPFMAHARGDDNSEEQSKNNPLCFSRLAPVPTHIVETTNEDVKKDWFLRNWGCYSIAYETKISRTRGVYGETRSLAYEFLTKELPPSRVIRTASEDYPDLTFTLFYCNHQEMYSGICVARRGQLSPRCYDLFSRPLISDAPKLPIPDYLIHDLWL